MLPAVATAIPGRFGKVRSRNRIGRYEESDGCIVPAKPRTTPADRLVAETVEGRGSKEGQGPTHAPDTEPESACPRRPASTDRNWSPSPECRSRPTFDRSPVRESRTPGSARGAGGNSRSYRDQRRWMHPVCAGAAAFGSSASGSSASGRSATCGPKAPLAEMSCSTPSFPIRTFRSGISRPATISARTAPTVFGEQPTCSAIRPSDQPPDFGRFSARRIANRTSSRVRCKPFLALAAQVNHKPSSRLPTWGASSAAAKIYSNNALLGLIPVGFRVVQPLIAEYGVLTWRTSPYARHVFGPASRSHAVNRPLIREVAMACNTLTHGYLDWLFTNLTAVLKWRATR